MQKITKEELRAFRENMGWTQEVAAQKMNAAWTTYRNWEQGVSAVPSIVAVVIRLLADEKARGALEGG